LAAVLLVGFYGVAESARDKASGWRFSALPLFVNPSPIDVRDRALAAMRAVAGASSAESDAAAELVRLGGAALPHILPRLDTLGPSERGRVALALVPIAERMGVAASAELASAEQALLFFGRFWQDRAVEFRPSVVRRAVQRLSERSLAQRREDVMHADTYALEALVAALGEVRTAEDAARVARLHPMLRHTTGLGEPLAREPELEDARRAVESWRLWWLEHAADFTVLEGPKRVVALVTETQYGKWFAIAGGFGFGRARDASPVLPRVLEGVPVSALHVLTMLVMGLLAAAVPALRRAKQDMVVRLRERLAEAAASLVASYPLVLTLALAFELATGRTGVLRTCASSLRAGDVNLMMGSLIALVLLAELLVALPAKVSAELGKPAVEDT
jgi:hypothetical protein